MLIATADSEGRENEMDFKKGDEIVLEEARTDGWWYCFNKVRNDRGWVYKSFLEKC